MIRLPAKRLLLKTLVFILEFLALAIVAYLIISLSLPKLKYRLANGPTVDQSKWQDLAEIKKQAEQTNNLTARNKEVNDTLKFNRIIIPKIGVDSPIIESLDAKYALNRGAWRTPETSTPDQGGNTVITGHRYKYLPPNNLTFYLLDKLVIGDLILINWQEKNYYYRVKQIKIVEPTEVSILNPTAAAILTIYTCEPIYSQERRLVVIAEKEN